MCLNDTSLKKAGLGLLLVFILIYLLPLNLRQLSIPDEMRYGELAREMLVTGDFITPRLNGLRYFEKPAGGHILNAASLAIFGETNFGVRFMSAFATGLSALALVLLLKKNKNASTAILAGFIMLTSIMVMGIGTFSLLDAMVTGFITLTLCCFYPALTATGKKQLGWLALTGIFAGGAFLVKGFVALAVPVAVIGPYLLIRKEWKRLFTLPWIPLLFALILSLPWCIAVALRESDYWHYFFWEEHINRFFSSESAQHKAPFWYYIPVFIGGSMPWLLIAPLPMFGMLKERIKEPIIQFGICWMIMPFLLFSASSGKLGTYILPCFAPFSLLLAIALKDIEEKERSIRPIQIGLIIFTAVIGLVVLALPVAAILEYMQKLPLMDYNFTPKFIVLLTAVIVALGLMIRAIKTSSLSKKMLLLGSSIALVFIMGEVCLPVEVSSSLSIQKHLESQQHLIDDDTLIIGDPKTIHALCYVYKRNDVYMTRGSGELSYGINYPDAEHRYLEPDEVSNLINQRGAHRLIMAIRAKPTDAFRADYPEPDHYQQWLKIWYAVYEPLQAKSISE